MKIASAIILVHFPENNHHGCDKHCSFCLFDKVDYNIECKPTDKEVIDFMKLVSQNGKIQICGMGDPLFNFEKNKSYLLHLMLVIHSHDNHQVELVTRDIDTLDENFDILTNWVDSFVISIENEDEKSREVINKITKLNKKVRIAKVFNLNEDIYDINWNILEHYIEFYSNIENQKLLTICFRPNYSFKYNNEDVKIQQFKVSELQQNKECRVYMHGQSSEINNIQLWNGKIIPCSETDNYTLKDMNIKEVS